MEKYKNIQTFDALVELEHGSIGSPKRNEYEEKSQMFIINEMLKAARKDDAKRTR